MAKFVLTAQIQLQAPNNASQVVQQINKQLQGVSIPVSVKAAGAATKQINQLTAATQKASSAADAMGRSFGLAIKRFAAFTVASRAVSLFTNSLASAIDDAIEFQREIVRISQVTGKSVKELAGLKKTISDLAGGLGISSKELLSTATVLSQAGIGARDLNVALEALAKTSLAATFDSMEQTAEGAIAILAQFGQGVGALEVQLSSVNAVSAAFAVESEDLISAVRRFGGVFKTSGGSLEELLALFTSVRATTRESAESISTGLRTIFTRIQRPKTIEFLRQFGVELTDLNGKFVGPFEAAKRLSEAFGNLEQGDVNFIRVAEELGGFRQIGKVIPLLQQFAIAQDALSVATEGSNSLTTDAATAQKALSVQITKVKEEFYSLVRNVADSDSFQIFARTALELASAFLKVADSLKPLIPLIGTFLAFNFAKGIGTFASGAGAAIRGLGTLGKSNGGRILGFARGGSVPGVGNQDTVPAMLTPGEFVIRKSSVNKIGADKLAAMNENRYNKGGEAAHIQVDEGAIGGFFLLPEKGSDRVINMTPQSANITNAKVLKELGLAPDAKQGRGEILDNLTMREQEEILEIDGPLGKENKLKKKIKSNNVTEFPQEVQTRLNSGKVQKELDDKLAAGSKVNAQNVKLTGTGGTGKATITAYFPGGHGNENKTAEIARAVETITKEKLNEAVVSASTLITKPDKKDNANSIIQPSEEAMKAAGKRLSNDPNALSTVEGFIFEGMTQAITGAELEGGNATFDFPSKSIPKDKKGLKSLFGQNSDFTALIKADAKRSQSEDSINGITSKFVSDINKGNQEGVKLKPKPYAKGGSAGTDTVPALLTPGEFVVNKSSAQRIGYGNLNRMNKQGVAKFAKGGSVGGGWARYNTGSTGNGVPEQGSLKTLSGEIINTVEDFNKALDISLSAVPEIIKQEVLASFERGRGIQIKDAGYEGFNQEGSVVDSLGKKSRRGTIAKLRTDNSGQNPGNENATKIKVTKGVTDRTVGHEVGHGVDLAVGKMETGDAGIYASEKEGTFQKMIIDKVSPDIIANMRATGVSEERIKEYSGKNRELFANLYTDVKPAMQAILAHTGDAELGMIAMVDELRKTGDTFSGLSASDLRPEIEGIRDAARATREALEKQQGELEGQKSIAEEEIASRGSNITELKAKQAEQKLALDNVDVKTPTKEITTSFNVTGKGNKKLNQGQIEEEIRRREAALQSSNPNNLKAVGGKNASKESVTKELDEYKNGLAMNAAEQVEQAKQLKKVEEAQYAIIDEMEKTDAALRRETESLDRATAIRDKATAELQANSQSLKAAGDKESKANVALGNRQPSVKQKQTTAIATGKAPTRRQQTAAQAVVSQATLPANPPNRPPINPVPKNPAKSKDVEDDEDDKKVTKSTASNLIAFSSAVALAQTAIQSLGDKSEKAGDTQATGTIIAEQVVGVATILGGVYLTMIKPMKEFRQGLIDADKEFEKARPGLEKDIANTKTVSEGKEVKLKKKEEELTAVKIQQSRSKTPFSNTNKELERAELAVARARKASVTAADSASKAEDRLKKARGKMFSFEAPKWLQKLSGKDLKFEGISRKTAASITGFATLAVGTIAAVAAVGSAISAGFEDYFNRQKEILQSQDNLGGSIEAAGKATFSATMGSLFTIGGYLEAFSDPVNFVKNANEREQKSEFDTAKEFIGSRSQVAIEKLKEGNVKAGADEQAIVAGTVEAINRTRSEAQDLSGPARDKGVREADNAARQAIKDFDDAGVSIDVLRNNAIELSGKNNLLEASLLKQVATIEVNRKAQEQLSKANLDSLKSTSAFGAAAEASERLAAGLETGVNSLDLYSKQLEDASGKVGVDAKGAIGKIEEGLLQAAGNSNPSLRASIRDQANVARATNDFSLNAGNNVGNLDLQGTTEEKKNQIQDSLLKAIPVETDASTRSKLENIIRQKVEGIVGDPNQADVSKVIEDISSDSSALAKGFLESGRILASHNATMIGLYQKQEQLEQKASEAANQAIETQLEAAKIFEEFGGSKLTSQQELGARVSQFNNVGGLGGLGAQLSSGNAGDIRKVANEIGQTFNDQTDRVTSSALGRGKAGGGGVGPFAGPSGFSEDKRQEAENANKALVQFTKQRLALLKEELAIAEKKNQAEKDSLESLISGDIEGFLEKQAAAGAGAALASGSSALTGLFSGSALGAGFKTLDGQGLSDDKKRRAEDLTLQRFGVKSTGALSGTTTEEQAIKSQGRELAGVLGELSQQEAQFAQGEFSINNATIVASNLAFNEQLKTVSNQNSQPPAAAPAAEPAPPRFYRGGPVYANRGMFVPRGTDTVPAMLTPGEFVVNRSSVQRGNNLQILQAMNKGGGASAPGAMSGGGKARYYNVGGAVDGVGSTFSAAIPQLTSIFNNFAATVDKLIGSKFQVALDTTNINVNFNGASFLETMKEDIKKELLTEVGKQISQFKTNTSGDLKKTNSVLG